MLRAEPKLDRSAHAAGDPVPTRHALGAGADSWIAGVDAVALLIAVVAVQLVAAPGSIAILAQAAATAVGLLLLGHYGRREPMSGELPQIALVVMTVLAGLLLLRAVAGWPPAGAGELPFAVVSVGLLLLGRLLGKAALYHAGIWPMPTLLIGPPEHRDRIRPTIAQDWYLGYVLQAELDIGADLAELEFRLARLLADRRECHVILAFDHEHSAAAERLAALLDRRPEVSYDLVPPLSGLSLTRLSVRQPLGHDGLLLCVAHSSNRRRALVLKRLVDLVLASALVLVLAPLLILLALVVKSDGGPALYGSPRLGRHGRRFAALKFRSMVPQAEAALTRLLAEDPALRAEWNHRFKLANDPRITPIGRFLRRTSLDELPQLFNVIKGDMSLVGPRPMLPEERSGYGESFASYSELPPGITGVWQVSGRDDVPYERRILLNNWYLRNLSISNDLIILCKTAAVVLRRLGAS